MPTVEVVVILVVAFYSALRRAASNAASNAATFSSALRRAASAAALASARATAKACIPDTNKNCAIELLHGRLINAYGYVYQLRTLQVTKAATYLTG